MCGGQPLDVSLSAVGVSVDGTITFDCTIRDLTAHGSKSLSNSVYLPDRFYLINIRDQVAYDATVSWKRNGEVGLIWNEIIPLKSSMPDLRICGKFGKNGHRDSAKLNF